MSRWSLYRYVIDSGKASRVPPTRGGPSPEPQNHTSFPALGGGDNVQPPQMAACLRSGQPAGPSGAQGDHRFGPLAAHSRQRSSRPRLGGPARSPPTPGVGSEPGPQSSLRDPQPPPLPAGSAKKWQVCVHLVNCRNGYIPIPSPRGQTRKSCFSVKGQRGEKHENL